MNTKVKLQRSCVHDLRWTWFLAQPPVVLLDVPKTTHCLASGLKLYRPAHLSTIIHFTLLQIIIIAQLVHEKVTLIADLQRWWVKGTPLEWGWFLVAAQWLEGLQLNRVKAKIRNHANWDTDANKIDPQKYYITGS